MGKNKNEIPEWLLESQAYEPRKDREKFINKSIQSMLKILAKLSIHERFTQGKYEINVTMKVFFSILLIVLLSLSRSSAFLAIVLVYLLCVLCLLDGERVIRILKMSLGATFFSFVLMIPALWMGNHDSAIMIVSKVFVTITIVGVLTHTARWYQITAAIKAFHVPNMFIMILDITIKYIYRLGEFSLEMFYGLKLRSIGKNDGKYQSMAGIAGNMFLQSKEMAEEMHQAMECRGFTGEYQSSHKSKWRWFDYFYMTIHVGLIVLFFYFFVR